MEWELVPVLSTNDLSGFNQANLFISRMDSLD